MLRSLALFSVGLLVLALSACGSRAERGEMRDDLTRFRHERVVECEKLKRDFARYALDQKLRAQEIPLDLERFLEWRRREWWNLTDEMAVLVAYDWDAVEKLTADVSRYYGYNVRMFPRLGDDVARFFEHADPEWDGLVRDVAIFIEWRDREWLPLREDLKDAYNRLGWESTNLAIDVHGFLQWREREWNKLRKDATIFLAEERQAGQRMRDDIRRFRAARALEANRLTADFSAWWSYETTAMPPRLIADVYRYASIAPQELLRLRADVATFGAGIGEDAVKLVADVDRYASAQVDLIPLLAADVERFFQTYEREIGPLGNDVERWWRTNVALGILLRSDLQDFFIDHTRTETAELQAGIQRFFGYAGKEWKDFRAAWARFLYDDSGRAFGDRSVPMVGDGAHAVFDDPRAYPVRGYDAGTE